jgi:hypothetical protein
VGLAAADGFQAQFAHEALDGAAGHRDPLAVQLPPDLAGAIDPKCSAWTRRISTFSCSSRRRRAESGRRLAW